MIDRVDVFANKVKVGTLALTKDKKAAFQYTDNWIKNGFSLNPFKLPLSNKIDISTAKIIINECHSLLDKKHTTNY